MCGPPPPPTRAPDATPLNDFVQFAGFTPQSEFAAANISRDTLGGGSNSRQFIVVNRARAVHRDVIDPSALNQVDNMPVYSSSQHMRAHHQDARGAAFSGG